MTETKSIYEDVYNMLKDEKTKIAKKAFDILNKEGIAGIIESDGVFWFEYYSMGNSCPEQVYNYLVRFIKKNFNLKYLYELQS